MLRDYQQNSINLLYKWFENNNKGNVCVVLPTGAGKSHIVAALCKDAVQNWPDTKVLMMSHQQELISQNAEKMLQHWPNAPLGIYSASIGKRELGESITFAGIQSVRTKGDLIGHIDLVIVDECHLISHKDEGGYRELLEVLTAINPALRVVGLTATPWRLGHGRIDEGEQRLFHGIIEPVTIEELVHKGFLSPLRSKFVEAEMDVSQVKKRGGEFVAGDLGRAVDTDEQTQAIIGETIQRASHCRSVIVFASGVDHARHLADEFNAIGWKAATVTGATGKAKREMLIEQFKAGELRVLTNAEVLTTGFDAPNIDCVVMARPTMSPVLYVQIAGRGMRLKEHTDHCLVLDFAGNVRRHGPITSVQPPGAKGKGGGEAPIKPCPECGEVLHLSATKCTDCGYLWPIEETQKVYKLYQDDIMGITPLELTVTDWAWRVQVSRRSGKEMIVVSYYHGFTNAVKEYLTIEHEGYSGSKAVHKLADIATGCNAKLSGCDDMQSICDMMAAQAPPDIIRYRKNGKLHEVINRVWK